MDLALFPQINAFFRHPVEMGIKRPYHVESVDAVPTGYDFLRKASDQGCQILMRPVEAKAPGFLLTGRIDRERLISQHMLHGGYRPGRMVLRFADDTFRVWIRIGAHLRDQDKARMLRTLGVKGQPVLNPWSEAPGSGCFLVWLDPTPELKSRPKPRGPEKHTVTGDSP